MILQALPDIPRWYTGLAEWSAALVYISIMRPRFAGWARFLVIAAALPIMIAVQVLVGRLPLAFWTVGMAAAVFMIFGFIHLCTSGNSRDSAYLTARAFVLAELVASLEWQLWVHWHPQDPTPSLGNGLFALSLMLLIAAYAVGFGAAYLAERRNFPQGQWLGVERQSLVTALAISIGTFAVSNLSFLTTSTPFSGRNGLDIFYIRTLVDLAGFVALYTQQSHRNQIKNAMELAETRLMIRSQHDQYLQSKRNIEELNRMHHDLKYYVAAIREEDSADMRSEYLNQLEDSIRGYESEVQTGNPVLDVILSSKLERCHQEQIAMTLMVDGAALEFMDLMRMSALFGNALDNAIEACQDIPEPQQRIIKVSAYTQADFVLIRFENYWPKDVSLVGGLPQTTKADKAKHGYGLRNMKSIVESFGGSLTIGIEDQWFNVRILIPRNNAKVA